MHHIEDVDKKPEPNMAMTVPPLAGPITGWSASSSGSSSNMNCTELVNVAWLLLKDRATGPEMLVGVEHETLPVPSNDAGVVPAPKWQESVSRKGGVVKDSVMRVSVPPRIGP